MRQSNLLHLLTRTLLRSTVFIFLIIFSLHLTAFAKQDTLSVSIQGKEITIAQIFKDLQQQTGYIVFYNNNILNDQEKINIDFHHAGVEDILNYVIKGRGLTYVMKDRFILLKKSKAVSLQSVSAPPDRVTVSGIVKDRLGSPLPGVSIQIAGTTRGTTTDENGKYKIEVAPTDSLMFSYVGYETQILPVRNRVDLDVVMEAKGGSLNEVVVVGYGMQKKSSMVGAISTVSPKSLQTNQTGSLSNSLAGRVPGVIAVQRSGEPGYDASDFWIRGMNTFGANSHPLVLIDGVERDLNYISPEEIESFTVLKDATATAVYGVRGANGVVLIKTKRGRKGRTSVTIKTDYGISTPTKLPQFVGAPKYMETINEAYKLSGLSPLFSEEDIRRTRTGYDPDLYANTDWLDVVTRPYANNGRISMDVNGGSDKLQYRFVGSFFDKTGIITTDSRKDYNSQLGQKQYNLRSNVDLNLTNSTKIHVGIGGYITDRRQPGVGISTIFSHSMDTPPNVYPYLYSNGQIPKIAARYNPWSDATQSGYKLRYENQLQTQLKIEQDIGALIPALKGLTGSVQGAFDAYNIHSQNRTKTPFVYYATGRDDIGNLITTNVETGQEFLNYSTSSGGNRTIYLESRLNYNRTFNEKQTVTGLLVFNLRDHVDQDASTSVLALPYRNIGIAGRTAYNYDDKYFAEFDFGYNGSENFKKGKRFGFFPSFGIGWMMSNEDFFSSLRNTVSEFKLRGSWGLSGNDQISGDRRFSYISTIEKSTGYSFGYTDDFSYGGYREGDFGVDDLTWETAEKIDLGIELGLFNGAINIQADWFQERRRDILMQRKIIPSIAGFNIMPYANFGKVHNEGFEVEMQANKRLSKDWQVSFRGSVTYAKNKIIEYDEPDSLKKTTRARTGHSMNQHFGLVALGLYEEADFKDVDKGILKQSLPDPTFGPVKPGDIKYKDLNDDGIIDSYDEMAIGKPYIPQTIVGFGMNTKYKNIDFGFLFQGATNFTNMLNGATLIPGSGGGGTGNVYANVDDRWTPENPTSDVTWPRLSATESANNMRYSTWWLVDNSYLRLKYLEIGFTFPQPLQDKLLMKNARIFLRGTNLLTFSYFKMWDPEIGSQDGLKYPLNIIMTGGVEVTF